MLQQYTRSELSTFNRTQLWELCRERGLKCFPKSADCVEAILNKQQSIEKMADAEVDSQAVAQTELVARVEAQTQTVALEIKTVEISFYEHEVYAGDKLIADIWHDSSDFQTQRWVVMVGNKEIHRANSWAKCYEFVVWHYKQGTLPANEPQIVVSEVQFIPAPVEKGCDFEAIFGNQVVATITEDNWASRETWDVDVDGQNVFSGSKEDAFNHVRGLCATVSNKSDDPTENFPEGISNSEPEIALATLQRTERAKSIEVLEQHNDEYVVRNIDNGNHYVVRPNHANSHERCECGDAHYRGVKCKHQIAVETYKSAHNKQAICPHCDGVGCERCGYVGLLAADLCSSTNDYRLEYHAQSDNMTAYLVRADLMMGMLFRHRNVACVWENDRLTYYWSCCDGNRYWSAMDAADALASLVTSGVDPVNPMLVAA